MLYSETIMDHDVYKVVKVLKKYPLLDPVNIHTFKHII